MTSILTLAIRSERDVVVARQRARQIAGVLGFDAQDQTRIATAVSEIARNTFHYAKEGVVEFGLEGSSAPQVLVARVADRGPGISDLNAILEGRYRSPTGMGLGIVGARRLMDRFEIESVPEKGTTIVLKKLLPPRVAVVGPAGIAEIAALLAKAASSDPFEEVQRQNRELLQALGELEVRQRELVDLNRELEETNRGVVALYAELDEKADHLRRADELKSRFLSNMSHEFRTPVNSIQALTRLLLDRSDGELTPEQDRQVTFIRNAADALSDLVNDLLDLAKVEAGKIVVRPVDFEVEHVFGALRGMLRPLLVNESVALVFDAADDLPPLHTDEAKVSQILRNFISNALKFTERGEVRVSARPTADRASIAFSVSDTGIGIEPEDHERIFEEFAQIDSPIQRRVKGTGLGLPLCRKLAELLHGTVAVESTPGLGSTFTALIPIRYEDVIPGRLVWNPDPALIPILVIEDSAETLLVYERMLASGGFQLLAARSLREARAALAEMRPRGIVLDIMLQGEDSWSFLTDLKRHPHTQDIPVAVITSVDDAAKGIALGADAYCVKPLDRQRLVQTITQLVAPETVKRILLIDDEEVSRYVLRQAISGPCHLISEATSGTDGIRTACAELPDLICLDLGMPDLDGGEVLRRLKADPTTCRIPVVIVTARDLGAADRDALLRDAAAFVAKDTISRDRMTGILQAAFEAASGGN